MIHRFENAGPPDLEGVIFTVMVISGGIGLIGLVVVLLCGLRSSHTENGND